MNNNDEILVCIFFGLIGLILIDLIFIAIYNAKIEKKMKYKGFVIDVLIPLMQSGGTSKLINPLPRFAKKNISKSEEKMFKYHFVYVCIFWVLLFSIFIIGYKLY